MGGGVQRVGKGGGVKGWGERAGLRGRVDRMYISRRYTCEGV